MRVVLPGPGDSSLGSGVGLRSLKQELQHPPEFLNGQSSITDDAAHGNGVDRIGSRNGQDTLSIRHDDMLPLTDDAKPGLHENANCVLVTNAR